MEVDQVDFRELTETCRPEKTLSQMLHPFHPPHNPLRRAGLGATHGFLTSKPRLTSPPPRSAKTKQGSRPNPRPTCPDKSAASPPRVNSPNRARIETLRSRVSPLGRGKTHPWFSRRPACLLLLDSAELFPLKIHASVTSLSSRKYSRLTCGQKGNAGRPLPDWLSYQKEPQCRAAPPRAKWATSPLSISAGESPSLVASDCSARRSRTW